MKVGVIGCGYWGPKLIRNLFAVDGVIVAAVCDRLVNRLKSIESFYPSIKTLTTSAEELINSSDIDAIVICTPVTTHYELARAALEQGKHVLVEKALTASSDAAERLVDLAERKKLCLMVDHTFVYTGAVRTIKDCVARGEVGDLYYFDSVRVNLGLFQHDVNVIWDLAPHDVSIMDYLLERMPRAVSATGTNHLGNGKENIAYLTFFFDDNVLGHIHVNWLAPVKVRKTLLSGSKRMIVYDDMEPSDKVKIYDRGVDLISDREAIYDMLVQYRMGDMFAPKIDLTEALLVVAREFYRSVNEGSAPLTDGPAGLRVVRILEAADLSMKHGGRAINLD
jgi:predicted dehydrogenase